MVRARRGESESSECITLTAMMTAISAVHWQVARALLRFGQISRAAWHDLFGNAELQATFGPTRPRNRVKSCRRPIRTYVGTTLPAWQPLPINWRHGLTAESETSRPVGLHHSEAEGWRRSPNRHLGPLVATIL